MTKTIATTFVWLSSPGSAPGEEISLRWDDIDWQRKLICVRRSIGRFCKGPTKTVESKRDVGMLPIVEQALRTHRARIERQSPWIFANRDGGPLERARTMYQTRYTFATLMLELGESPGWVARQLGHTNAEMAYRRYHRFIPNLRGRDGANAARGLALEGFLRTATVTRWSLDGHSMVTRQAKGLRVSP